MIPRHLSGYHLFWIDFGAALFVENCVVLRKSTTLRRFVQRGTKSNPIHDLKTKTLFKRYRNIIHNFVHRCWHLNVSYVHLHTAVRDRAFPRSLYCPWSKLEHPCEKHLLP